VPEQAILWRRLDKPGHEFASLSSDASGWHLSGTAVFVHEQYPCCLDYSISCDSLWRTHAGRVSGSVGNEIIELELSVNPDHNWFLNGKENSEVAGCLDLDLNFSPSTNLLPIRRLNLSVGEEALVRAAWLRFPTFQLELLEQLYVRIDANTYRYESAGGRFVSVLDIDAVGFVKNYADIWQMEVSLF
jgi:hypothetical protein